MPPRIVNASWSESDPYIEGFERALAARGCAEIADHLPDLGSDVYPVVLRELVRADLEFHWESGRPKWVEDYLGAFPCLREDPWGLSEIAFEEYRLRCRAGEEPSPEEYLSRLGVDLTTHTRKVHSSPVGQVTESEGLGAHPGANGRVPIVRPATRDAASVDPAATQLLDDQDRWFDDFHLTAELGRGAIGRAFLARQGALADRLVVLKVGADLTGEELSLAQLQHSNIVPVYSVHRAGPLNAICMPYFGATTFADILAERCALASPPTSGRWLTELIRRRRQTDGAWTESALLNLERRSYIDAILVLAAQLAEGLAYAHERGIIHRDLKPANLLLSDEGRPMILDFNLSSDARRATATEALIGGTLAYMAPECLESFRDGSSRADAGGDLYALGLILYQLLCGVPAFPVARGTIREVLDRSIQERRGPLPDPRSRNPAVSPAVASILRRCLEPDPARRYQSASELREDLERHLSDRPLRFAADPSPRERASKWMRRHPRLTSFYVVGALGASLLVVLGLLYARRGHRLAGFEAAQNLQQFRDQARTGRFLLNDPSIHPEEKAEGLTLIRRAADRYHVLDRRDWSSAPEFALLSPADRSQVRRELAEILLHLAAEEGEHAAVAHKAEQAVRLERALHYNDLAAGCSLEEADRSVILFQHNRLRRQAGDVSAPRDVELPPPDRKTRFELYLAAHGRMTPAEYRAAAARLRQAIRLDPQDPFVHYALGNCELVLGRPEQARARFDTSIALWPRFYRSYYLRAGANADRKDYEAALADFDEAIRLRPDFLPAYADRAQTRATSGDHAGALDDLSRAIESGGQPTRLYFLRARIRQQAGDDQGALRDQEEGLRRRPTDELSWVARGLASLPQSPDGALADFNEALKLDPRCISALEAKASVLSEQLGRTEDAIRVLDDAVRHHPDYPPVRSGRGVLLARLGRRAPALADARASLRLEHQPEVTYQVAGIYALTSREHPADRAEAFRLLEIAFDQGFGLELVDQDPELVPIRSLPKFREIIQSAQARRLDDLR
jgi:serine/threonine protein kinase/Tfp pilus assembly protein PilF